MADLLSLTNYVVLNRRCIYKMNKLEKEVKKKKEKENERCEGFATYSVTINYIFLCKFVKRVIRYDFHHTLTSTNFLKYT